MPAKHDAPFRGDAEVADLVEQFEACRWPCDRWTHRCHLAVAVSYLRRFPFDEALARVRAGIQRYNLASGGDPNGYHETVTVFFMRLVAHRLGEGTGVSAADVVNELCDSAGGKDSPLAYYTPELLGSAAARTNWVEPDRRPLDF